LKRNHCIALCIGMMTAILLGLTATRGAAKVVDRIVAVVNEDIILLSELNSRLAPYAERIRQQTSDEDKQREMLFKVREDILNRLVDEKLTDQEIKRNDIQVDEAQIDATIERIKSANYFTDEDLRRFLEQEQMTMDAYRSQIREQILRTRLVNYEVKSKIVITEEDIKAYYDNHPEIYGGKRRYHLRNILLTVPNYSSDDEKQAIQEQLESVREKIEAGESFADLARRISQGPTAASGGDIGEFETASLSPQIQTALEGVEPGQTTAVLNTDLGFQLFFVESINRDEGKPLDSVREEIHQKLFTEEVDKKFLSWLEDLRERSHIKIIK
jgi:peptidyl-prolyl cis-trans isomerase SurA